jgi:proteasome accessory factor C
VTAKHGAERDVPRILALVPWLDAHPGEKRTEVAARFGITVEQLDDDLSLVLMIGVPPYTPAEYIDVDVDEDDRIWLRIGDFFRRPLKLSASEGLAVLAAGRALLAVPGSDPTGPLATALDKLAGALESPDLQIDVGEPEHLAEVRAAADAGAQLEIDYWSAGRDARAVRVVDPRRVFFAVGQWYLDAYCHRAHDQRMFRVDRIRAVHATGQQVDTLDPDALPIREVFNPGPDDVRVTLVVPGESAWIGEKYPAESVEEVPDGRSRIVLAVSEPSWLERLLLRLGPDVEIESPADWIDRRTAAASRVLARYRS